MTMRIGHRGASGYEPENTLRAFKKAIELKADMVELDVRLCNSGEPVVIHDERLDRTTNGTGLVAEKPLKELKKLDAGKKEKIPTLQEVLEFTDRKVKVNIELKDRGTAKPVVELIKKYVKDKGWSYDDFLISSFSREELKNVKSMHSRIKISVLACDASEDHIEFADALRAESVNYSIKVINKKLVDKARRKGLKVLVGVANDKREIRKAKRLKVDGIFSDYPDRI
jgi:glycerophosphoryl diester phosphodiesterase